MLRNYFKTAWRNLSRNKMYSFINIAGLTIGLTACLLVAMVVIDELSYDKQWTNAANIYRVLSIGDSKKDAGDKISVAFSGLAPTLKKDFPEVKDYCRMSVNEEQLQLSGKDESISVSLLSVEPSVWNVLNFKTTAGNPQYFIKGYANLVITEKMKQQYFANTNPVGKTIQSVSSFGDPKQYIITGIIADIPSNTHLAADALLLHEFDANYNELIGDYGTFLQQYILLKPGTNVTAFTSKVNNWYQNDILKKKPQYVYQFQPVTDVYLGSDFSKDANNGSIQNVYIFSGVATLLLLIACINFINLTTARALKRVKETGIRKVIGAGRQQLTVQFLCESLLFFFIAFLLSLLLYIIFLPAVENYLRHPLAINLLNNITLIAATTGVVLLVSLFTGLYPAWLLSGSQPVDTIKGKLTTGFGAGLLRKALVTGQFIISAIVLLAAIIVQYQLHFLNHKDLGFNKNNLFKTEFASWDNKGSFFKQQVAGISSVESVSLAGWTPDVGGGSMSSQVTDPTDTTHKID